MMLGTSMIGGLKFEPLPDQHLLDPPLLEHFSDLELVELELVELDVVDLAGCNADSSTLCSFVLREFELVVCGHPAR